jgi:NAD(P)-dependent dehydrogenase (short-subunit alcohol dehydrogenase family)
MRRLDNALRGKTAFITGAASGLGAALANALAAAGADIVAADIRPAARHELLPRLRAHGVRADAAGFDVSDPAQAHEAIERILDRMGRLDILVNNAGTDAALPIDELREEDWLRVIGTNLHGPFLLSKYAALHMRRQGWGDIVNIVSTSGRRAWPKASAWHASKWGMLGLSHALHAELRPHGIRVTAVVAGSMRTPPLGDRVPELDPNVLQDPADVAQAILGALLLPRASAVPELTVLPVRETSWP